MAKRVQATYGAGLTTFTIPNGSTAAIVSNPLSHTLGVHQGKICGYKITAGDCTAAATFTLSILDVDGDVIYSLATIAKNAQKLLFGLDIPMIYGETIRITPSIDPASAWLFTGVYVYYYPDSFFRI